MNGCGSIRRRRVEYNSPAMRVCFFGTYESGFPRMKTLREGLRLNGHEVIECHVPFWEKTRDKREFFSDAQLGSTLLHLVWIYLRLIFRYLRQPAHDLILVGYNGYFDMPVARFLSRLARKPLVYSPVFPLYETLIEDRAYVSESTLRSRMIHFVDEFGCRLSDMIVIETQPYLDYYVRSFGASREKMALIPLGADEKVFHPGSTLNRSDENPQPSRAHPFTVLFYGKFIPLQGLEYIVRAAKLLEAEPGIQLHIIGAGQLSENINQLATDLQVSNVRFTSWVDLKELPGILARADLALGIFGDTTKARRGVPIKAYEALAVGTPLLTGASPAAKDFFRDGVNAFLCEMADEKDLAETIVKIKNSSPIRSEVGRSGRRLFEEKFATERIGRLFVENAQRLPGVST